eukprot:jgi/Bigna1/91627/estExt_fgenesh1_pg.C_1090047
MIVANNLIAFGKNGCTGEELAAKLKLPQKVVQSYLLSDLLRDKIIKQEAKNLEEDMELDDGRDYNKLSYQQKVVYRNTMQRSSRRAQTVYKFDFRNLVYVLMFRIFKMREMLSVSTVRASEYQCPNPNCEKKGTIYATNLWLTRGHDGLFRCPCFNTTCLDKITPDGALGIKLVRVNEFDALARQKLEEKKKRFELQIKPIEEMVREVDELLNDEVDSHLSIDRKAAAGPKIDQRYRELSMRMTADQAAKAKEARIGAIKGERNESMEELTEQRLRELQEKRDRELKLYEEYFDSQCEQLKTEYKEMSLRTMQREFRAADNGGVDKLHIVGEKDSFKGLFSDLF